MTIGAKTPELRSLADLRFYESGSSGLGYSSNMAPDPVVRKLSYLRMAEDYYLRAEAIVANPEKELAYWKDLIFEVDSSWYYLILAASCGEI